VPRHWQARYRRCLTATVGRSGVQEPPGTLELGSRRGRRKPRRAPPSRVPAEENRWELSGLTGSGTSLAGFSSGPKETRRPVAQRGPGGDRPRSARAACARPRGWAAQELVSLQDRTGANWEALVSF
jgi:hypothetical protein